MVRVEGCMKCINEDCNYVHKKADFIYTYRCYDALENIINNGYKIMECFIDNEDNKPKGAISPVPENNEDGADYYLTSGFYGQYVDIEGVFRNEYELIKKYREMSLHPE